MCRIILFSGISFILGGLLVGGVFCFNQKKASVATTKSKIIYSTQKTEGYYFPTHNNLLVMDRSNAEVAEVFIVEVAPNKQTHRHIHNDTEQLFYVLSGKGKLILEREDKMENYTLESTNVVHIPRNCFHQVFCEGADSLRYLAIDCFPLGKNTNEPTWDDHAKAICSLNGWDYSKARIKP